MASNGRVVIVWFILSMQFVVSWKLDYNNRPAIINYDYWVSSAHEAINSKNPFEIFGPLGLHPLFDQFTSYERERLKNEVNIFDIAASKLKSYISEWRHFANGNCTEELSKAVTALKNLASTAQNQCELGNSKNNKEYSDCEEQQRIQQQLIRDNLWILQIINAYGSPRPGLFHQGQYLWFGSYHQCRYTSIPTNNQTKEPARYCMVSLGASAEQIMQPNNNSKVDRLRLQWGTCLPNGCVEGQKSRLLSFLLSSIFNATQIIISSQVIRTISRFEIYCENYQFNGISSGQTTFLLVLITLLILIVVGTVVDYRSIKWAIRTKVQKKLSSLQTPQLGDKESVDVSDVSLATTSAYSFAYMPSVDIESVVSYKSQESLKRSLRKGTWWMKFLTAFSLRLNVGWLFQTRDQGNNNGEGSNRITCLYGIKALTMVWVIVGHSYIFCLPHVSNLLFVANVLPRNLLAQIVLNASLSVDTFFLVSGLLTSYTWCLRMLNCAQEKRKLFSFMKWFMFYAHRILRLLPPYAFVLAFASTWFTSLGGGPQWNPSQIYGVQCEDSNIWWRHLLLISNLLGASEASLCLPWMWYVAADIQMYMVTPIFLTCLWKLPKVGIWFTWLVILASAVARGVVVAYYKFPTNLMLFLPNEHFRNDFRAYFEMVYEKPYFRCGPYLVGVLIGWCLANHSSKLRSYDPSRRVKIMIWTLVCFFCLWPLFGIFPMFNTFYHPVYNAIFAAVNRTVWSIGVGLVIVMCHTGQGGSWVNSILSWKKFWPASRLTYSVYLTHELIMLYVLYTMPYPIEFGGHLTVLALFFMFLAFTYPSAFVCFILTEAPMLAAERLLFRRKPKRKLRKVPSVEVDRSLMAKRWADVINNENGDAPPGGWSSLYEDVPQKPKQRNANDCSRHSASSDSDSMEIFIEPDLRFEKPIQKENSNVDATEIVEIPDGVVVDEETNNTWPVIEGSPSNNTYVINSAEEEDRSIQVSLPSPNTSTITDSKF